MHDCTRRGFVASASAFGVAALLSKCVAAQRSLKISPIREGNVADVLKVTPIKIDVGAKRPFRMLHASDTHLNFWNVSDYFGNVRKEAYFGVRWVRFPQALTSLVATVAYAQRRNLPILHTGDLLDWNTGGNASVCSRILKGVDMFYAIGNHEYHSSAGKEPELSHGKMRSRISGFIANDLTVASRMVEGVNFVSLDNAGVNLPVETIDRVKAEFSKGLPVVALCHIPPSYTPRFLENAVAMRRQILLGQGESNEDIDRLPPPKRIEESYDGRTREFWNWMREQTQLKAILCGHTHVVEQDQFSNTARMYVAGGNYEGHVNEIAFT